MPRSRRQLGRWAARRNHRRTRAPPIVEHARAPLASLFLLPPLAPLLASALRGGRCALCCAALLCRHSFSLFSPIALARLLPLLAARGAGARGDTRNTQRPSSASLRRALSAGIAPRAPQHLFLCFSPHSAPTDLNQDLAAIVATAARPCPSILLPVLSCLPSLSVSMCAAPHSAFFP
jgi:hypothetical protein